MIAMALGLSPASAFGNPLGDEIALAGTVTLKSGNTLVVRNGGVDTRVIVDQDTVLITRTGGHITYTDIELGDRIQAFGELVATRTLHADTVRNMVLPRGGFEKVITGVVASKLGNEVIVRSGVTDISVFLDQDTLIVDRTGLRTSLSALDIGDRVQAFGDLNNGDLDADTVVNLSLAVTASTSSPLTLSGNLIAHGPHLLVIRSNGVHYTVHVTPQTLGYERNGLAMSFARMRIGDLIHFTGSTLGTNVLLGSTLRDLSVAWR